MPRYSLRTLMLLTAFAPPAIAFVWLSWWILLITLVVAAAMAIHLIICLAIANLCGRFVASLMG
jgi:hypothetical protein